MSGGADAATGVIITWLAEVKPATAPEEPTLVKARESLLVMAVSVAAGAVIVVIGVDGSGVADAARASTICVRTESS